MLLRLPQSLTSTFIVYYCFIPSIVSDFLTYSLSRLDDWTWGNKDKMVASAQSKVRRVDTALSCRSAPRACVLRMQAETGSGGSKWSQTDTVANAMPVIILVGNILLTAAVMYMAYNFKTALVALGEAVTGVGITIMFCSAIYFTMRRERAFLTFLAFAAWIIAAISVMAITTNRDRNDPNFRSFFIAYVVQCLHAFVFKQF